MSDVLSRIIGSLLGGAAHGQAPAGDVPPHADSPLGIPRLPGDETGRGGSQLAGPWGGGRSAMPSGDGGLGAVLGGLLGGGQATGAGGGLGGVLGGLLGGGGRTPASGGGGLLSGLGGVKGLALVALLAYLMRGRGGAQGLGALAERLQGAGLGPQFDSWVSDGDNREMSPAELSRAIPPEALDAIAGETGLGRDELLSELSRGLPHFIDRLTPQGRLPARDEDLPQAEPDEILGSFGLGPRRSI